jgi:hypothetical protein
MPRSRCHLALLYELHGRLRAEVPGAFGIADANLPDYLAGGVAPDAMRHMGGMGKLATHFYTEDRSDTWGQAVARMFAACPDLADPAALTQQDQALVLGYISHLTVDEAFRDTVTAQLHGLPNWRPVVRGLWSLVDELPIGFKDAGAQIDRFTRQDAVGFVECGTVGAFLVAARGWAIESDPWEIEKVFLDLVGSKIPLEIARAEWRENRRRASGYLDGDRRARFVQQATALGLDACRRYLKGGYVP